MHALVPIALSKEWKQRLGIDDRSTEQLCQATDAIRNTAHAGAIRMALRDIGISAIFCIQEIPTIAIIQSEVYDAEAVKEVHAKLWNQGLAQLLLVICGDTIRIFTLSKTPKRVNESEFEARCLIETLTLAAHAAKIGGLVYGAESGRLWTEYSDYFVREERVDRDLLKNLRQTHERLVKNGLLSEEAQALLIQTMFIAYLEDRGIIGKDYYTDIHPSAPAGFQDILDSSNLTHFAKLFAKLQGHFNGDLFVAPCSFEISRRRASISEDHLRLLKSFRCGDVVMDERGDQLVFWGYDFKYIPIELISAVYDKFLGEQEEERRDQGAYYTPMFLSDIVVSQVWEMLNDEKREHGIVFDPACGSGIFLVRIFQRLCEHWRSTRQTKTIRWDSLLKILARLHGCDINAGALRITGFSLYLALLQEVSPPDIQELLKKGRILPTLWGGQLRNQDFFAFPEENLKADIIIGNPPWASRRASHRLSIAWCQKAKLPMPLKEEAWAFAWKSMRHLRHGGVQAFLLPAMGFLHNHSGESVQARRALLSNSRVKRVIDFSDLRFILFAGAVRPTSLIILEKAAQTESPYKIDFWAPKADLNAQTQGILTLSHMDKCAIHSQDAITDPLTFKRSLWMSKPEVKLYRYLAGFPDIGEITVKYSSTSKKSPAPPNKWVIGQGLKPGNRNEPKHDDYGECPEIRGYPHLRISEFSTIHQEIDGQKPLDDYYLHRAGFIDGFTGPRILIPRGIAIKSNRLRAAFCEKKATVQDIFQIIRIPESQLNLGKAFAAIYSSKLMMWFALHATASFGTERPEIKLSDILRLPFPMPADLPDKRSSEKLLDTLSAIIDECTQHRSSLLHEDTAPFLKKIDALVYQYFGLSAEEIKLVEDTVEYRIPAIQPSANSKPEIWKPANRDQRHAFSETLISSLSQWFTEDTHICAALIAANQDIGILKLSIGSKPRASSYQEEAHHDVSNALHILHNQLKQPISRNFQLFPDYRFFSESSLYLVKPMQLRFWLPSTALADADSIALDLQQHIDGPNKAYAK